MSSPKEQFRALFLRSSSRLQPWQSRQPCVVAAVQVLNVGQSVVSRGRGREQFCKSSVSGSKIGSMKTAVGVGQNLRTLVARVVNIACDWQRRPKKSAEPPAAQKSHKKPPRATSRTKRATVPGSSLTRAETVEAIEVRRCRQQTKFCACLIFAPKSSAFL